MRFRSGRGPRAFSVAGRAETKTRERIEGDTPERKQPTNILMEKNK